MGPRLEVDPGTYTAASLVFGVEIAGRVERAAVGLREALAASSAMAGSDPAGTAWAAAYDDAAVMATGVTQDVVNGCLQLAALLRRTGFNYGRAESWSTPGGVDEVADLVDYASCSVQFSGPPSAAGGSVSTPSGWWLIEHAVGYAWPNGHQDRLRAAGAAWTDAALAMGDATLFVSDALECIASQVSPEADDAVVACQAMDRHLWDLIELYRGLGTACSDYAGHIDETHSQIEHELACLAGQSAAIQGVGFALAVFTLGGSEVGAQAAEAGRIAAAAARVAHIIERLINLARCVAESMAAAVERALEISARLKPLLRARLSTATVEAVEALPLAGKSTEVRAVSGLTRADEADLRLDRVLATLRSGRRKPNLEVDTVADLDRIWSELSVGGKPIESQFPGSHLQLRDGTTIGYRMYSRSGGATIEITRTDGVVIKVHLS